MDCVSAAPPPPPPPPPPEEEEVAPTAPSLEAATLAEEANTNNAAASNPETTKVSAYDRKFVENLTLLKTIIRDDGYLNYSALDAEAQKHMQNFVKVQRRAYRQRENTEPSPMTDERFNLLLDAKFPFEPFHGSGKGEILFRHTHKYDNQTVSLCGI